MTQEQRQANTTAIILEVIDSSDAGVGVPLISIEEVLQESISFKAFVRAINLLRDCKLIIIDSNHLAHRVRG